MPPAVRTTEGRVSVTATPLARPGPEFEAVMTNPMESPAETFELSATLVMWMEAPSTVTEADAVSEASLTAETYTLSLHDALPILAAVVGEVMWTCLLAPLARVPKEQE